MLESIECEGAPRDLGFAQGRACKDAVRDHVSRSGARLRRRQRVPAVLNALAPWSSGPVLGESAGREIIRHYPHLAERMAGLALGADLPLESLVASLSQPAPSSSATLNAPGTALAVGAAGTAQEGQVFATRSLAPSLVPGAGWVLRHSRPEVGFASVEVTLPWLASSIAGVNTEGVAVLLARSDISDGRGAPPALLVQECLQRFANIDGCLDWCLKRSASGRALLFIAQASGGVAAVEFEGSERRVIRPSDGLLIEGARPAAEAKLRKARAAVDAEAIDWVSLAGGGERPPGSLTLELLPSSRRLIVQASDASQSEHRTELVAT